MTALRKLATKVWLATVPALLLLGLACGSDGSSEPANSSDSGTIGSVRIVETTDGAYTQVGPPRLKSMLSNKDFLFVNVHVPYEGEIEGTDLFIPYDQIGQRLSDLPSDPGAKIVLYCRSGRMSAIAAEALVSSGYTNVWDLKGGMIAWKEAGYPIAEISQ